MTARLGEQRVTKLIEDGEIEQVRPDQELADLLMDDAHRHLDTSRLVADADPAGAYQLAYDAARKACSALLAVQGLRATSRGGHIAIRDVVLAQLGQGPGTVLRQFDAMRRRRKDAEYPQDPGDVIDADEVRSVLPRSQAIVDFAQTVLPNLPAW